jgi:phenylalanyl-tRNA synthetase beta chain
MVVLRANKHRDLPQRIFEIGDVVHKGKNRRKMAFVSISAKSSFTEAKSLTEAVLRDIGAKYSFVGKDYPQYIPGRACAIMLKKDIDGVKEIEIGNFGELHPKVITSFELGYPVIACEIDIENVE